MIVDNTALINPSDSFPFKETEVYE